MGEKSRSAVGTDMLSTGSVDHVGMCFPPRPTAGVRAVFLLTLMRCLLNGFAAGQAEMLIIGMAIEVSLHGALGQTGQYSNLLIAMSLLAIIVNEVDFIFGHENTPFRYTQKKGWFCMAIFAKK